MPSTSHVVTSPRDNARHVIHLLTAISSTHERNAIHECSPCHPLIMGRYSIADVPSSGFTTTVTMTWQGHGNAVAMTWRCRGGRRGQYHAPHQRQLPTRQTPRHSRARVYHSSIYQLNLSRICCCNRPIYPAKECYVEPKCGQV
jgi:hypothetical protein